LAAALLIAACTQDSPHRATPRPTAPSPTVSDSKESGLCQPFPDRLIDEFLAAYNGRDLEALRGLVAATHIEDDVAAAYSGEPAFDDVGEWARVAWDAGDRIRSTGYSAFHPSKDGFQMLATRASDRLDEAGIESVSTVLSADTDGCAITSLASAGPVQARGDPCAFYEHFGAVAEPRACADGSARFARSAPAVATDGRRVLVWGGSRGGYFRIGDVAVDGFVVDLASGRSTVIAPPEMPAFRPEVSAWTGDELVVLGAKADHRIVGAAYDLDERSWRRIDPPFAEWTGFEGVWTGSELILWGGPDHSVRPRTRGAVYEPSSGTWRRTSPAPIGGRWSHAAVWTGSEMVVWGGSDANTDLADGAAYDPDTDTWRRIAPAPLAPRQWMPITWTVPKSWSGVGRASAGIERTVPRTTR
jgi:hypothetical protein